VPPQWSKHDTLVSGRPVGKTVGAVDIGSYSWDDMTAFETGGGSRPLVTLLLLDTSYDSVH
jgi:hypothetical protein